MLATILAGIALGSYIVTPFLDRPAAMDRDAGIAPGRGGPGIGLSFWPLAELPSLSDRLDAAAVAGDARVSGLPLSGSLLAIFPTALLMGTAFPIGLRVWAGAPGNSANTTDRVGRFIH